MKLNSIAVFSALAGATLFIQSPAVQAQEPTETSGFYFGGGVGQYSARINDVDQVPDTIDKWKDDDTAYKIFAGYRLNRYLGFEADYINLGKTSGAVVPGFNVDSSVDGFAPYVIGTLPIGQYFEVFGRAGYYFYDANMGVENVANNRVQFKEESKDPVWGGGIGANIGEKLGLRLEYERFDIARLDKSDALWLTADWRF